MLLDAEPPRDGNGRFELAGVTLPQGFGYAWSGISLEEIKAGRQLQNLARGVHAHRFFKFRAHRDGMRAIDRHTHAGHARPEVRVMHDLAAFVFHLHFLLGVAGRQK